MGRFFALFALDEFQIRESFKGCFKNGGGRKVQRGSEGNAAYEAMLERGYFWHLSEQPESARSYRPPKNDIVLANIVAKRLVPGWPVPLDHQLAAGYIRECGIAST